MSKSFALSREQRLRRSREFKEIYARGRKVRGPYLTLFFRANQLGITRLGLSVTKKRCRLSTRRHFIQRRLREAYRLNKMLFLPGYDLILASRWPEKDAVSPAAIKEELLALGRKAGLLKK